MVGPDRRVLIFESHLERKAASVLVARPDIVHLWDQPPAVNYKDYDGSWRRHTFDFLATRRCGTRFAIAVKPAELVKLRNFDARLRLIAQQVPPSYATGVILVTEKMISDDDFSNSLLLRSVLLDTDFEAYELLTSIVGSLNGATTVAHLGKTLRRNNGGFRAVVRLISEGVLVKVGPGLLSPKTLVRAAERAAA